MNASDWISNLPSLWHREWHAMFSTGDEAMFAFISGFPFILSLLWSSSTVIYLIRYAVRARASSPGGGRLPSYSVLVPFFGNPGAAMLTVRSLDEVTPAPDEIIMIDDGSPVECGGLNNQGLPSRIRLIRLPENEGKAEALNRALQSVKSDIIVCLDADTVAETTGWSSMLRAFASSPELGAITGNIRPRRVRSLVQILQAIDYLAVICMVKCAEALWGGLTTVSGAWVAYRREALLKCGGWNRDTCAEDIELSWRMQANGWRISYDHRWIARVDMARSWRALWLQRRRWSSGLARTLREQLGGAARWKARHFPIAFVAVLSAIWMWTCACIIAYRITTMLVHGEALELFHRMELWAGHHTLVLALCVVAFTIQIFLGMVADRGSVWRYPVLVLFSPCYIVYFWFVLVTSYVAGFARGITRRDTGQWMPTVFEEGDDRATTDLISSAIAHHTAAHSEFVPINKP